MLYIGLQEGVEFKSQFCQDVVAYAFFKGKRDGFFVDIGAHDGITGSNTYAFEKLGWKGFCVEPNPDTFAVLRQNRTGDAYEFAVTATSGETVDFLCFNENEREGNSQFSVVVDPTLHNQTRGGNKKIVKVKTTTFTDLMTHYPGVIHIDFLSLDTEGYELPILQTIDFERYTFGLIAVEANSPGIPKFMDGKGYRLLTQLGSDGLFVRK